MHSSLRFLDYTDIEIKVLLIIGSVILDKFLKCFLTCKIVPSDRILIFGNTCILKKKKINSLTVGYFTSLKEVVKIQPDIVLMNTLYFT